MHEKLKKISHIFRFEHHTTIASLADAILTHHLEAHRELLSDAYERYHEQFWARTNNGDIDESDADDSESCSDDAPEE
jgi:hypothetical protein